MRYPDIAIRLRMAVQRVPDTAIRSRIAVSLLQL